MSSTKTAAKRRATALAPAPSEAPTGRAWCPYFYLLPTPDADGTWQSGVLRRTYNGRTNDVVEFTRSKLHPVDPPPAGNPWKPTAARAEVLLPPGGTSDLFLDPQTLVERYAEQLLPWQTSLLSLVKITLDLATLNEPWQIVHSWAVSSICRKRGLPVILVQHAPFLAGVEGARAHLHALILCRRTAAGSNFAGLDFELTCDEGHPPLYRDFKAFAAKF
jgi:hypothetical protein